MYNLQRLSKDLDDLLEQPEEANRAELLALLRLAQAVTKNTLDLIPPSPAKEIEHQAKSDYFEIPPEEASSNPKTMPPVQ